MAVTKVDIGKVGTITKNGITLSSKSGSGNATITVTATANTSKLPRTAYFTISNNADIAITIKVTQLGTIIKADDITDNTGTDTKIDL